MNKILSLIAVTGFIAASFLLLRKTTTSNNDTSALSIGILQTASHPALDAARDGFIEEFQSLTHVPINFIVQNAQGSVANAHTLAQKFHANSQIKGIFAIATPAVQAMAQVEKEKPIFMAAVTDPNALGIMHPTSNVTGSSDMINVADEIDMIQSLMPKVKNIAIIFNNAERNSIILADMMKKELIKRGLNFIEMGVTQEADLGPAVETAARKADALLAPTDNTIASAIQLVSSIAQKHNKPLFVSDNLLVPHGALAARGVDYKESGKQAARMAFEVLIHGKKPYELPLAHPKTDKIFINKKAFEHFGLTLLDNLKDLAVFVE